MFLAVVEDPNKRDWHVQIPKADHRPEPPAGLPIPRMFLQPRKQPEAGELHTLSTFTRGVPLVRRPLHCYDERCHSERQGLCLWGTIMALRKSPEKGGPRK
jgi:hypothetical protein